MHEACTKVAPKAVPYGLLPPKTATWRDETIPYRRTALLICKTAQEKKGEEKSFSSLDENFAKGWTGGG